MYAIDLSPAPLPEKLARELFEAWIRSAAIELGLSQTTGDVKACKYENPGNRSFSIKSTTTGVELTEMTGISPDAVIALLNEAARRTINSDFGPGVVYQTTMEGKAFEAFGGLGGTFHRAINDEVHITGKRRLSDMAILEFMTDSPPANVIELAFLPVRIKVSIVVPGPCHSPLTQQVVSSYCEIVAATCALALGRPVDHVPPLFDEDAEVSARVRECIHDDSILGLARDSVSLEIVKELGALGGPAASQRAKRSLLSFHAALRQSNADLATILFVSSLEALIAPDAPWGRERLTKRFIMGVLELGCDCIDRLLEDGGAKAGFGVSDSGSPRKRRKDFLTAVYESRSRAVHGGIDTSDNGIFGLSDATDWRHRPLSALSISGLLGYIRAPRSSIVGYPVVYPVEVTSDN